MPSSRRAHRQPPWWPEGEPWPPAGRHFGRGLGGGSWDDREGRRRRRRFGCLFIGCITVVVFVFGAVAFAIASLFGLTGGGGSGSGGVHPVLLIGGALVLAFVVSGGARFGRRVTQPVDDLLSAADRLADGDYDVRVAERGPYELRAAARALNTLAERLAATEARRRALLADVTHELRTPLTVVRGGLEGMLDGIHPRDDKHLAALRDETLVLDRLIEDLRTLALAEVGALRLAREPVAPAELASEAVAAFRASSAAAGVTLTVDVQVDLPTVSADPVRIGEVLRNLLANALRYTPAGGSVAVGAVLAPVPAAAGFVTFSVRDTGAGLTPGDAGMIFDRYHRSADSTGSGLGLSIAREIVAAHGGSIAAASDGPGRGTTITFTLPVT